MATSVLAAASATDRQTDRGTNRQTDGRTDGRTAWWNNEQSVMSPTWRALVDATAAALPSVIPSGILTFTDIAHLSTACVPNLCLTRI